MLLQGLLFGLQFVQLAGAGDDFGVLFGLFGSGTGGKPVLQALLFGGGLVALLFQFQCGAFRFFRQAGVFFVQAVAGLLQQYPFFAHVVVQFSGLFDGRQVVDDFAAQSDEEGGKNKGNQPQAASEPFFG